jgi:hypothetical protein
MHEFLGCKCRENRQCHTLESWQSFFIRTKIIILWPKKPSRSSLKLYK